MILNEVNFFSEMLAIRSTMYMLLPQYSLAAKKDKRKFRTLYLLHGYSDDHTAWVRWTALEKYVEGLNLVVVMPAGNTSFYTDMTNGKKYFKFISEEVPAVARNMFPLSAARKDNYVAGLSMGGYGAFKLALTYPERYAAAASLSGTLDVRGIVKGHGLREEKVHRMEMQSIFGDLSKLPNSNHDLFKLAKMVAKDSVKPRLYQACGTEDFLYADNVRFRDVVRKLPLDLTYEEGPGEHVWSYWDMMIQNVLKWMFPNGKDLDGLIGL